MPDTNSTPSRARLRSFSDYLREAMSPETWAWYSKYRAKVLEPELLESNGD